MGSGEGSRMGSVSHVGLLRGVALVGGVMIESSAKLDSIVFELVEKDMMLVMWW